MLITHIIMIIMDVAVIMVVIIPSYGDVLSLIPLMEEEKDQALFHQNGMKILHQQVLQEENLHSSS